MPAKWTGAILANIGLIVMLFSVCEFGNATEFHLAWFAAMAVGGLAAVLGIGLWQAAKRNSGTNRSDEFKRREGER